MAPNTPSDNTTLAKPRPKAPPKPTSVDSLGSQSITSSDTGKSRSAMFVSSNERVGKYRIIAELGRGGAASVHLAVARGTGGVHKLVVLKALLPELAEESDSAVAFLDEARLAAQLNHPNVVQTYEVGIEGGRHVIVMEYLEGQSLSRLLRTAKQLGQPIDEAIHLRILIEMLEGLDYAHELRGFNGRPLQVVHRDVSPQNVIVTYEGQVKILDFGIAKASTTSTNTAVGVLKGKIAYMSPEQVAGMQVDRRSDIYSAGCMLWAVATGQKLWQDCPDVDVVREVLAKRIPSPKRVNPNCPDELERIIMNALAPEPEERYPTARALQQDIEHYAESLDKPVKQRDIGKLVSEMFAEGRTAFNERMERELVFLLDQENDRGELDSLTADTEKVPTTFGSGSESPTRHPKAQAWKIIITSMLLVSLATVVWAFGFHSRHSSLPSSASTPAPNAAVRAVVNSANGAQGLERQSLARGQVVIRFRITPPRAQLIVDGSLLTGERMEMTMNSDGQLHEIRAEAEGYEPQTRKFTVNESTTVELNLIRKTESKHGSQRGVHVVRATTPTPAASSTVAVPTPKPKACDNPFFVDSEGIKRVRPDCM